jgi:hypothetical protein
MRRGGLVAEWAMRLLFFILLVVLIAQIGFWNTLGAIVGAVAMVVLLALLAVAVLVIGGMLIAAGMR